MRVIMTLGEVLDRCKDWEYFCANEGWDIYVVNEGGGDIDVSLPEEKAIKYGIINKK